MTIYIPDFWAGFCVGWLLCLALVFGLMFWAKRHAEKKSVGRGTE